MASAVSAKSALSQGNVRYPGATVVFCVCTLAGCFSFLQHHFQMIHLGLHSRFSPDIFIWLACLYPWVPLAPFVFRIESRFPLSRNGWPWHLATLTVAGFGVSLLAAYLTAALVVAIQYVAGQPVSTPDWMRVISGGEFAVQQFLYWLVILNGVVIRYLSGLREHARGRDRLELEKSRLETSLQQAQLEMLRMRLNPHFLFNTLQNISMLALREPRTASEMLSSLGDLLRAAYRRDYQAEITLSTELNLTRAYLDIEKMRFGGRLTISVEMGPETEQALVPTFLLQPLVENAIVHGLRGAPKLGTIGIRSVKEDERLVLTVTDNGAGVPAAGLAEVEMGVGLGSVAERLAGMYPEAHELELRRLEDGGTEVRAALPFRRQRTPTLSARR